MKNPRIYRNGIIIDQERLKRMYDEERNFLFKNTQDLVDFLIGLIDMKIIDQVGDPY